MFLLVDCKPTTSKLLSTDVADVEGEAVVPCYNTERKKKLRWKISGIKLGGTNAQKKKVLESCEVLIINNYITYFYLWWPGHMTFKLLSKYNLKLNYLFKLKKQSKDRK